MKERHRFLMKGLFLLAISFLACPYLVAQPLSSEKLIEAVLLRNRKDLSEYVLAKWPISKSKGPYTIKNVSKEFYATRYDIDESDTTAEARILSIFRMRDGRIEIYLDIPKEELNSVKEELGRMKFSRFYHSFCKANELETWSDGKLNVGIVTMLDVIRYNGCFAIAERSKLSFKLKGQ